jgi:hypothetical protein
MHPAGKQSAQRMIGAGLVALLAGMAALSAACSSGDTSSSSGSSSGDTKVMPCGINGCDPEDPMRVTNACVTNKTGARRTPVHLIFSVDITASLCQEPTEDTAKSAAEQETRCKRPNSKWVQLKAGLKAFLTNNKDQSLADISVSLIPWSAKGNGEAAQYCSPTAFSESVVPLNTLLPSDVPSQKLEAILPVGLTPTPGAIRGAATHAKAVTAMLDGGKTVLILVTDGVPNVCPHKPQNTTLDLENASIQESITAAKEAKAQGLLSYVIGVGDELDNLNAISQGFGAGNAIRISTSNPSKVGEDLLASLESIRGQVTSCSLRIPASSQSGEEVDRTKVNLSFETTAGKKFLTYSQDCKDPNGWKYDRAPGGAEPPTRIELCSASCAETKANTKGQLELILGCKGKGFTN